MNELQDQFERGVAERFFEWLSLQGGPSFTFLRRAGEAPDLVYACGSFELQIEVTAGYYDAAHAAFLWKNAQDAEDAPIGWERLNPVPAGEALADAITRQVAEKCNKRYGGHTLLLVEVPPGLTSAEELAQLLAGRASPPVIPFAGIYVAGRFPITSRSTGGYRVLPIKKLPANPTANSDARKIVARRLP